MIFRLGLVNLCVISFQSFIGFQHILVKELSLRKSSENLLLNILFHKFPFQYLFLSLFHHLFSTREKYIQVYWKTWYSRRIFIYMISTLNINVLYPIIRLKYFGFFKLFLNINSLYWALISILNILLLNKCIFLTITYDISVLENWNNNNNYNNISYIGMRPKILEKETWAGLVHQPQCSAGT